LFCIASPGARPAAVGQAVLPKMERLKTSLHVRRRGAPPQQAAGEGFHDLWRQVTAKHEGREIQPGRALLDRCEMTSKPAGSRPHRVNIERYRYRGARIPTRWSSAPTTGSLIPAA
jgi:hypothetical protein